MSHTHQVDSPPAAQIDADLQERLRTQLPNVQVCTYLNAGTLGPVPHVSLEAQAAALEQDSTGRTPLDIWEQLTAHQAEAREAAADLAGAKPAQIALMHSTHEGINACLGGIDLRPGDNIVTTSMEHPAVYGPLRLAADRHTVQTRIVDWPDDDDAFVAAVCSRVDARTRAVIVSHVAFRTGLLAPLRKLAAALDGPLLIVDGAQGAGALPVSIDQGWDAYTVSGQKWPGGPHGCGALVLADPSRWLPTYAGFGMTQDPEDPLHATYTQDARRLEHSHEGLLPLAGFTASTRYLIDEVGVHLAAAHSAAMNTLARELLTPAVEAAHARFGTGLTPAEVFSGERHLLSMRLPSANASEIALGLYARSIVVRSVRHDTLRISLGYWTTPAELEHLAAVFSQLTDR